MTASFVNGCSLIAGEETILQGWVYTQAPISEATLTIYSIEGKQIYKSNKPVTGDMGSFIISVKNLPADFKIAAQGGKLDGQAYLGELIAEYRNFNSDTDIVYVNEVTTITGKYLEQHKDKTLDEAVAAAKSYLAIPEWLDIGSGLQGSDKYFNHNIFSEEADSNGGINQYINQLVAKIDTDKAAHPFIAAAQSSTTGGLGGLTHGGTGGLGGLQGVGGFVARTLVQGAISYTGGKLFGWGLDQMGIGFKDETEESINQMKQQLAQISQQLTEIKNQMNEIYNKLSAEIKQTGYDIRIGQMNELISSIDSIRGQLLIFVTNPPSDKNLLDNKRKSIISQIENNLLGKENIIHNQQTGINGQTPLLKVWCQIIQSKHRFLSADDYPSIKAQFDYFDKYQEWLLLLLVEYYHAIGEGEQYHAGVDNAIQGYENNMIQQSEILVQQVPANLFVDTKTGNMWWRKPILETPRGTNLAYLYKQNVAVFVHGSVDNVYKDKNGLLTPPNPDSDLNTVGYNGIGTDFHDWVLPTLSQLDGLMEGYTSKEGSVTDWFIRGGAFPQGLVFDSIWGKTGGNVWTREWYWQSGTGEVVNIMVIGVNEASYQADIFGAGKYQDAAIFPVRVISTAEKYYWTD